MKQPLAIGLRARLVGAVLLLLTVLFVVTATVVVLRAEQGITDMEQARVEAVTRQLADATQYAVLARSPALLAPALEVFGRTPDLVRVRVMDEHGELIAEREGNIRAAVAVTVTVPVHTRSAAPGAENEDLDGLLPTPSEPRLVGLVEARFSALSASSIQHRMRGDMVLAFALLGGLGLLGVFLLASGVAGRIRRLARAAAQVALGDWSTHVDDDGGDELAALSRDFNHMTRSLEQQRCALDEAAQALAERESLAAIGRATAVIAHELRNPIGIMMGAAQIAANPAKPAQAREKSAQIMEEEARRLERTLNELLGYARPRVPERVALDAVALCRKAADRATHVGSPASALSVHVHGESVTVMADEQHAGQILLNLLVNAGQAGATQVNLMVSTHGNRARIEVADDGPGIPESVRANLFRPFVTTKQRGAGLGLAGSRRMARDNGGDLTLADGGPGARFILELPLNNKEHI